MDRKRDKKSKLKSINHKLKQRGFQARVDVNDKNSVVNYLNEEFQLYAKRIVQTRENQVKAVADAKHLRRRQAR